MKYQTQLIRIAAAFILFVLLSATFLPSSAQTTFTLEGTALPTPVVGVENDGVQVNAIVTNIGGGEGDNDYYYLSNPVDGGAGMWQTGEDFGDFGISWSDVTTTGTELSRVEADDLIRFNATGMVGTEVSLTLYALKDDDMSAAIAGDGKGNFADFAAARTAFSDISDAQTLSVTVQSPPPTTFELGTLPNPVAGTENGGAQVSVLVTNVMDGADGDSYYYVSELVDGGAGAWEENDGGGWSAITGTGFIVLESDDFIRFNASPGAVAGTVATLDFYVVNASSEPVDPGALPFISMAQTLSVTVQTSPSIRRVTRTGAGDGSTWATAMTLQAALMASTTAGDQVWIEAGTYKPHADDRTATFRIPGGVLVYGGFLGDEAALADRSGGATTLSGDLLGDDMSRPGEGEDGTAYIASRDDNSYSVVRIAGAGVTLDGLTITAGERGAEIGATEASVFFGSSIYAGAGLYAMQGATGSVVSNCNFTNNSIAVPGVSFFELAFGGGAFFAEDAVLTNCTFTGNSAKPTGLEAGFALMFGGGLSFLQGATATLTDCVFENNNAGNGGGAHFPTGATLTNCSFTGNSADIGGGALFSSINALLGAEVTLTACTFTDNVALASGGAGFVDGVATLTNCVVVGNSATGGPGGGLSFGVGGTVTNSTFYNNTATERGGGVYVTYDGDGDNLFNMRNSILVGNTDTTAGNAIYFVDSGAPRRATDIEAVMDHNLIGGGEADLGFGLYDLRAETYTAVAIANATNVTITNMIEESDDAAVFTSTDASDEDDYLRLASGSPAVGAGDNNLIPSGIMTDAVGAVRIQDGTVDLGAYESEFTTPTPQTLTFTDPTGGTTVRIGQSIDLMATTDAPNDAMLAITFSSSDTSIAEIVNDDDGTFSLRLGGAGYVTITATQAGGAGLDGVTYARVTARQTIMVAAATVAATIRRVTTTGNAGEDGSSWTNAMTLQAALAESDSLDQVWIAAGTYKPDAIDRTATFSVSVGVLVYGGFDGAEDALADRAGAATILSGDLLGDDIAREDAGYAATRDDNSNTVVTIAGDNATLDGLTITAGEVGTDLDGVGGSLSTGGAGLYSNFANTSLNACVFTNNSVTNGNGGGAYFTENTTLTDCAFRGNEASTRNRFRSGGGGGCYFFSEATLKSCIFSENTANGFFFDGGGVLFNRTATVTNCIFAENTANGPFSDGGGATFNAAGTVINSTFYNNTASNRGGGVFFWTSRVNPTTLQNSILIGNTAGDAASGHQAYTGPVGSAFEINIQNNLLAGGATGAGAGIIVANATNLTEAGTVGETDASVVFASTTSSNANYLRLRDGSPAVNAGNNDYVNNAAPPITTDAAGEMRIQGDTVDLGAYEGAAAAPMAQAIAFTSDDTGAVGDDITLAATGGASGLDVTFEITTETLPDGLAATTGEVATLGDDGTTLTLTGVGTVEITATQAGNANYAAATQTQTITVSQGTQTIEFTPPAGGSVGTDIELMATASSGLDVTFAVTRGGTGTATLGDNGTTLTLTGVGTVDITATQSGNANYTMATQTQTITVSQGTQTIAFTSDDAGDVGTDIELMATASSGLDVTFAVTRGGTGTATLESNGTTLTLTGVGTVEITATQAGNANYAAATQTQTIMVDAALPTGTTIRRVTTTGTGDGSSWVQAMSLQAALAASTTPGDQVWIAAGTYTPHADDRAATFTIPAGVLVYGGFDPVADASDTDASSRSGTATILSGDLSDDDLTDREDANYTLRRTDNSRTVVTIGGANVTLNGLTIEGGERGTAVTNFGTSHGAGLFAGVGTTGTTLTACTFNNNSADDDGGGAYFDGAATLTDCTFNNNSADDDGGGAYFDGAATLTGCDFNNNSADDDGGGAYFYGAATLTGCDFNNNSADDNGGGAYFDGVSTVTNCTFTDNETTNNGGGAYFDGVSTVINSTLYNNSADSRGGGLYVIDLGFPFILQNSILIGNTAADAARGHQIRVFNTDAAHIVNIQNNLIAGGADPLGTDQGVVYRTSGSANITEANTMDESDATVVFASIMAENANYLRLAAGSPAVNVGNNLYLNNGTPGETDDDIKTDAAGNARIQGGTVDLGAYESAFAAVAPTAQTLTFDDPTGGATVRVGQSIDLVATTDAPSDAMLAITFTSSATNIAVVENDGDGTFSLRFDGAGDVTITATQAGGIGADGVNYAMATATQTITVEAALPTVTTIRRVTTTGTGDGSSWVQAMSLQAALAASDSLDQVWTAAGTYKPDATNQNATFTIPAGVLVYGGFDPVADASDTDASSRSGTATILSGDLSDNDLTDREDANYALRRTENSYTVVTVSGANVTLNGLTIEGGERGTEVTRFGTTSHHGAGLFAGVGTTGTTLTACTFNNNSADDSGGGAYFDGAATLTDCTFNNNSADDSGGGAYFYRAATLTGCDFNDNNSDFWGGGGAFFRGTATVTNCTFTENTANGGSSRGGGALFLGTTTVTQCTFTDNEANRSGGGASFFGTATLANCVFANNSSAVVGGGLFFSDITGTVINSTFYNNTAAERGGGIVVLSSRSPDPLNLQNSILIGNTATTAGNAIYLAHTGTTTNIEATIDRNLIGGGMADLGVGLFDLPTETFADGLFADATNVALTNTVEESDATVVFVSTAVKDANYLRLAAGSPAVNLGNNLYLNNGTPDDTNDDIKIDAAGNARIQGGTVDLGAYEGAFAAVAPTAQTLTFDDPTGGATVRVGQSIDLVATTDAPSDAMLAITFTSSATNIAVVENDGDGTFSLRFDAVGDITITATQAGGIGANGVTYAMATDTQTITVEAALPTGTTIRRVTTTGTGDGSSWVQAMTLKAALAASDSLDQVWTAAGTYKPDATNQNATFTIPAGVLVYGGFGSDENTFMPDDPLTPENEDTRDRNAEGALMHVTILSGDLADNDLTDREDANYALRRTDNSYTVVTIGGANVTLNGLTIEGGERGTEVTSFGTSHHGAGLFAGLGTTGTTLTACTFNNNSADGDGGGAHFDGAATLTDCTFNNNNADDSGGGAYFDGAATLTNCVFDDNNAVDDGGGAHFYGATTLTGCDFNDNNSDYWGGGALFRGTATVTNCTFTENTANGQFSDGGGALFRGTATVTNCTFTENTANGGLSDGGGVLFNRTATVTNCTFTDNETTNNGGGAYFGGVSTVINSTLYNNSADSRGGGLYVTSFAFPFILQNSILIGNTATDVASGHQVDVTNTSTTHVVNIQNNLIAGGADPLGTDQGVVYMTSGSANVTEAGTVDESDATVVFASIMAENANYLRLAAGSPAVNAGNNLYLNNGTPDDTNDDIKIDAAGNARIQNRRVDLGAYESTLDAPPTQAITFADPTGGVGVRVGQSIDLVATTNALDLFVTFTTDPPGIATLLDDGTGDGMGRLRFDATGVVTVTAVQAGGDSEGVTYPPATSVTYTITVRPVGATIFRVAETATGTGDGSSWVQAMSLQEALGIAIVAGDQIWIAAGTYTPHADDRAATFTIPAGVLVYGGFDPVADASDTDASSRSGTATILSGDLADNDLTDREDANYALRRTDNSYTVVTIGGANVTLNGLTIEGGERGTEVTNFGTRHHGAGLFAGVGTTGTTLTACTFNNNSADDDGGGAYFYGAATLTDCTFNNNSADDDGGGAYFDGAATLTDCTFNNNNAIDDGGGAYFDGAATLTDCTFNNNSADDDGGGAYFDGVSTVTNCTFTENTANGGFSQGGGAFFRGTTTVTQCTFTENTANGDFSDGGGAFFRGTATVTNCTFTDNETTINGGGAYFDGVSTVINSTLYNNSADIRGGGLYVTSFAFPFILQNSILLGNTVAGAASGHQVDVTNTDALNVVNINYNLIAGGADPLGTDQGVVYSTSGSANVTEAGTVDESDATVVFASTDAMNANYLRLRVGSPAVNAGNNLYLNNGTPDDTNDDIKIDAAGNARIQGGTVDLGAYESAAALPTGTTIRRVTTTGTGDGSSWVQAMTLKAALAASDSLDQVWTAAGTYKPDATNQNATFTIPAGVLVYGGFGSDENTFMPDDPLTPENEDTRDRNAEGALMHVTILSGDLADNDLTDREDANYALRRTENSYTVVTVSGANVTLNGLTIEGGERGTEVTRFGTTSHDGAGLFAGVGTTGTTLTACTFNNNSADDSGGGAYFDGAATLTDCTFNNNSADDDGGGAYFGGAATLTNCVFDDNNAVDDGGGAHFYGAATLTGCDFNDNNSDYWGGGALFRGTATVTNCTFTENTANGDFSYGGGALFHVTATVTNCTFTDNETTVYGGGVYFDGSVTVTSCTFSNNSSTAGTFFTRGGGAYFDDDAMVVNCVFANNSVDGDGGGAYFSLFFGNISSTVTNSTFYSNSSNRGGGIYANYGLTSGSNTTNINLRNNILMNNTANFDADELYIGTQNASQTASIDNNLIQGGNNGPRVRVITDDGVSISNIVDASDAAVVFASTDSMNANYLRLKAGSPALNAGNDTYIPAGITTDAAGNARIQDGTVDLGAYEGISSVDAGTGTALGIEDAVDDFVLYPNPTSGKLHFSEQVGEFRLYSVEGRLLETWKNVRSADLTKMPSGLYFAEVIRDGRSVHYRIMRK